MALEIEEAEQLVKDSLLIGYNALKSAGEDAKKIEGKQVDISTKGDQVVGDAIIEHLRKYGVPFVVYTEEKGRVELRPGHSHSIIFDDIDGTLNFKEGHGMFPFGTIFGVFKNSDPTFDDCIASGFLEYNSGNLFLCGKGRGCVLTERFAEGGRNEEKITTSGRKTISGKTPLKLVPDLYMLGSLAPSFAEYSGRGFWLGDFRCKAVHLAQLAAGSVDVFVFANNCYNPAKKSTSEELGPGYLMVKEAEGAVIDWYGNDIGPQKIGLGEKKTFDIITASTEKLAMNFLREISSIPQISAYMNKR